MCYTFKFEIESGIECLTTCKMNIESGPLKVTDFPNRKTAIENTQNAIIVRLFTNHNAQMRKIVNAIYKEIDAGEFSCVFTVDSKIVDDLEVFLDSKGFSVESQCVSIFKSLEHTVTVEWGN